MDWSMILKMTVAMLLYVLITAWLCRLCRDKKQLGTGYRVLIGLVFGACSVASTHFGIPYQDTWFLNVQNMGPLAAGLFFSPLSGIIAGVIGGAERLLAGELWNVGRFTELACSLSTCLAGFVAAFLHRWVYKGERPPVSQAFFLGALTEVFHMYAILFTNRGSMTEAYSIVKIATVPMIAFTAVGMALCTIAVKKISGKSVKETLIKALHRQGESEKTRDFQHVKPKTLMLNRIKKRFLKPAIRFRSGRTPISMQVQRWLLVATIVMFLNNFVGSYRFQTRIALETASVEVRYIGEKLKFRYETTHDIDEILSYIEKQDAMRDATLLVKLENGRYWTPEDIAEPEETLFLGQEDLQVVREHLDQPPFVMSQGQEDEVLVQFLSIGDEYALMTLHDLSDANKKLESAIFEDTLSDILLFTVFYFVMMFLIEHLVVKNLKQVKKSLDRITKGNLNEQVEVRTSPEFSGLSDDINETVTALKGHIEAAEKRMKDDLKLAAAIQDSALPKNFKLPTEKVELYALMIPARQVGGDFYDFFYSGPDQLCLVIADVSGKGIPASLFMMRAKSAFKNYAHNGQGPAEVMESVNKALCEENSTSMFVTAWLGMLDLKTGLMSCCNAAHEYPAIMRAGGEYELLSDKHGIMLGAFENNPMTAYEIQLNPGDRLFVYTDGVLDAVNEKSARYGKGRLIEQINGLKASDQKTILEGILQDIRNFAGTANQFDDITMLGLTYK